MKGTIGVIGCGNMAQAIVAGIHQVYGQVLFKTFTPTKTRAKALATAVGGVHVNSLSELQDCDVILIGCKPQQFKDLAVNINEGHLKNKYFVSMMAAVSMESIKTQLSGDHCFSRIMPNTPISVGAGVTLLLHGDEVTSEQRELLFKVMASCSRVQEVDCERQLDQVTTITGCGPAYVYLFAQAFSEELVSYGLDEKSARDLSVELFKGASLLMEQSQQEPLSKLIDKVTSKGGVTIEAVNKYREEGFHEMTKKALDAALKRSRALTSLF